jgi:glycosyltransferase involved in cell wall biosynthesis
MLVILTNIPTPYRTAFFNELAGICKSEGIEFKVLYCARSEKGRHWAWDEDKQKYAYKFLNGVHPVYKHYTAHINFGVLKELKKLKPKWLIISGAWNIPTMILAEIFGKSTYKIFWSEGHANAEIMKSKTISWLRKSILKGYRYFAVPNELSKNYILQMDIGVKAFFYIPNTIETSFYSSQDASKSGLRKEWEVSDDALVFLQISALTHRKGVMELCREFINLPVSQEIQLIIAGDGPLSKDIDELKNNHPNKGRILLTGHLSQTQIKELLHLSDFFILNSKADPNPISSIEAAAAGLPLLLSSKTGNCRELVTEGVNGWIIDPNNETSLKEVLIRSLQSEKLVAQNMGKKSREMILEKFNTHSVAKELIQNIVMKLK